MKFRNIENIRSYIKESKSKKIEGIKLFDSITRLVSLLIFYFVIILAITLFVINFLIHNVGTVIMPEVRNMPFVNAYIELRGLNLNVEVEMRYYDDIPFGIVTSQSFKPEKRVKEKRRVKLIVSGGVIESTNVLVEHRDLSSFVIKYRVPPEISGQVLRVVIISSNGDENTFYNKIVQGDETLSVPVKIVTPATEFIYIGDKIYRKDLLK